MNLKGKIALVTGASRGIGQAIALALGGAGATVIGTATSEGGAQAISDTLRDYQRLAPDKYKNYITPDDLEFILDPLYINEAITKRNCSIVELSKVMSKNDHTFGETLRYWKDREFENMTLKTIGMFEKALREYDKQLEKKLSWEREQETKPKWDFKAERQRYLETGHFHHLQDSRA